MNNDGNLKVNNIQDIQQKVAEFCRDCISVEDVFEEEFERKKKRRIETTQNQSNKENMNIEIESIKNDFMATLKFFEDVSKRNQKQDLSVILAKLLVRYIFEGKEVIFLVFVFSSSYKNLENDNKENRKHHRLDLQFQGDQVTNFVFQVR